MRGISYPIGSLIMVIGVLLLVAPLSITELEPLFGYLLLASLITILFGINLQLSCLREIEARIDRLENEG